MDKEAIYVNEQGDCRWHCSGFAWLAVLSLMAWALQRRLYKLAALALLYSLVAGPICAAIGLEGWGLLLFFVIQSWVLGRFCNRWHQRWLLRAGWHLDARPASPLRSTDPPGRGHGESVK